MTNYEVKPDNHCPFIVFVWKFQVIARQNAPSSREFEVYRASSLTELLTFVVDDFQIVGPSWVFHKYILRFVFYDLFAHLSFRGAWSRHNQI